MTSRSPAAEANAKWPLARLADPLIRLIAADRGGDESSFFGIKDEFEPADVTTVQIGHAWPIFRVAVTNLRPAGRTPPRHSGATSVRLSD